MKTLIFSLVMLLFAGLTNAQEITELKEAKVGFAPLSSEVNRSGDQFSFKVNEKYVGEFEKDPIAFMNENFNVRNLISELGNDRFNAYLITFKSSRGTLEANFNRKGELVASTSVFKNILLPKELRHQLYRDHKGWEMVKNLHITRGRDGIVELDVYKIKLQNGKERRNIKISAPKENLGVAAY